MVSKLISAVLAIASTLLATQVFAEPTETGSTPPASMNIIDDGGSLRVAPTAPTPGANPNPPVDQSAPQSFVGPQPTPPSQPQSDQRIIVTPGGQQPMTMPPTQSSNPGMGPPNTPQDGPTPPGVPPTGGPNAGQVPMNPGGPNPTNSSQPAQGMVQSAPPVATTPPNTPSAAPQVVPDPLSAPQSVPPEQLTPSTQGY